MEQKGKELSNKNDYDMYSFMADVGKYMLRTYYEDTAFPIHDSDAIENIKRFIQGKVIVALKEEYELIKNNWFQEIPELIICEYCDISKLNKEKVNVRADQESNEKFLEETIIYYENELKNPRYNNQNMRTIYNNLKLSLKISRDVRKLVDEKFSMEFLKNIKDKMEKQLEKIEDSMSEDDYMTNTFKKIEKFENKF